jgi:cell division protein FtsL
MKRAIRQFKETVEIRSSLLNRLRGNRYFPIAVLGTLIMSAACVHIWQRVRVLDLVHDVSLLRQENDELADEVRKVYADVAALAMAGRVETYAADSLGMVRVSPDARYTIGARKEKPALRDKMDLALTAVKRAAGKLPSVTETKANAGELRNPTIDSLAREGRD